MKVAAFWCIQAGILTHEAKANRTNLFAEVLNHYIGVCDDLREADCC